MIYCYYYHYHYHYDDYYWILTPFMSVWIVELKTLWFCGTFCVFVVFFVFFVSNLEQDCDFERIGDMELRTPEGFKLDDARNCSVLLEKQLPLDPLPIYYFRGYILGE